MRAADVNEMGIVDLDGARRHTGQTRKATIKMVDGLAIRCATFFEHGADQIDAAAWRIVLVTNQHVGRASRGAKPVVDAGLQDAVGLGDLWIGQLLRAEGSLHD